METQALIFLILVSTYILMAVIGYYFASAHLDYIHRFKEKFEEIYEQRKDYFRNQGYYSYERLAYSKLGWFSKLLIFGDDVGVIVLSTIGWPVGLLMILVTFFGHIIRKLGVSFLPKPEDKAAIEIESLRIQIENPDMTEKAAKKIAKEIIKNYGDNNN